MKILLWKGLPYTQNIGSKVPDWRVLNTHITKEGRISKEDFVTIITETTEIMSKNNSVIS